MFDFLELGDSGWLRQGKPWEPDSPFFAVLGDPIGHSLSPVIQNAALIERGIDLPYRSARITLDQLDRLKAEAAHLKLAGFNATAPLKEAVAGLCDVCTEQGRDLGAVNTVRIEDNRWLGHNTDSGGLLMVLAQAWGGAVPPREAVVLGAGGSARAAVDALRRWQVPRIEVRNRSASGRRSFRRWLEGNSWQEGIEIQELVSGQQAAPEVPSVWIICLAGGVSAKEFLPVAAGESQALLLDLRYGDQLPDSTAPLGFDFVDGLPVLLMQGGIAFGWWFGPPVPWSAMREGLIGAIS